MYAKGLKGVIAAETKLSDIDGENGRLIYRGYPAETLAVDHNFEEIAYLLWYGKLPNSTELHELKHKMKQYRIIPDYIKEILDHIPDEMEIMGALRTVVSSLVLQDKSKTPTIDQAIQITSVIPTFIAYIYRKRQGKPAVDPHPDFNHTKNYLYMLYGKEPAEDHVEALDTYMILTQEHGMNASTFAARVTVSSESDIVSGITSAIGTMKGPLHGGAPGGVIELLEEINTPKNIEEVVRNKLENGEKLMGFGHRVYRTKDPRAKALKTKLLQSNPGDSWLKLALEVEEKAIQLLNEYKPGRSLNTNVEFYAAAIMKAIDMDPELFTPTFTASRSVGWTAHILEQMEDNTIFRPQSKYIGTAAIK
ncbi:MAG: citrate synthase/methylcitrate synthase [Bacillaceae bacterium]|nr:citrate synthase/methylcitrate synthase [Bacillaceae bacterium]